MQARQDGRRGAQTGLEQRARCRTGRVVPLAVWKEKRETLCKNFRRRLRKADQMSRDGARGRRAEIDGSSYYCYQQLYRLRAEYFMSRRPRVAGRDRWLVILLLSAALPHAPCRAHAAAPAHGASTWKVPGSTQWKMMGLARVAAAAIGRSWSRAPGARGATDSAACSQRAPTA